jgi:hypothetical protein
MAYRVTWQKASQKKNKYSAISQEYNGRWYHSKKEAKYAEELDWRMKAGELTEIKPQHKIEIRVNGKLWRNYLVDFRVVTKDGTVEYHEVKGFATEEWKMKWDLLHLLKAEILEPGAELVLIT